MEIDPTFPLFPAMLHWLMNSELLPENILKCMSPEDRAAHGRRVGHPNAGRTQSECDAAQIDRAEKEAQREIARFLNLLQIPHINPPMNKRSQLPTGWPDFTFAHNGTPYAIEVKVRGSKPRPDQSQMLIALDAQGWRTAVVSGVDGVREMLRTGTNVSRQRPLPATDDSEITNQRASGQRFAGRHC